MAPLGTTRTQVVIRANHPCADAFDVLPVQLEVTPPKGGLRYVELENVVESAEGSRANFSVAFDQPGRWRFRLQSMAGGIRRDIGDAQDVVIQDRTDLLTTASRLAPQIGAIVAGLWIVANVLLFAMARRSAWAWRVATDGTFGTSVFRVATMLLSHVPRAQLWILDQYFQRRKAAIGPARPFLPLPLHGEGDAPIDGDRALAPPWTGRRFWIQGRSGMGKSALFDHVTSRHFRDHATAFDAHAAWGCLVVPIAARDHAKGGDDKADPEWVVQAVKTTLAASGLTLEDDALLRRMLRSGTIAVAIDGLHEAGRNNAVEAFAQTYAAAPLLVTSQETGSARFANWRLPADMRDFTRDLLAVLLDDAKAADIVDGRMDASGLKSAIRSGYDLRLISDLSRDDPEGAPLPADRNGLYEQVLQRAWPPSTDDERLEQQRQTTAAAWRMVSERKPNEDKRRMKAGVDLPVELLDRLADAPAVHGRPVRLVRRVGSAYEFVHDQMHAYLAAQWFTQEGLTVGELHAMVSASTIWSHAVTERRTLWGFVAALLDDERLLALWARVEDVEAWDALRRELKAEAASRGLDAPPPAR